MKFSSTITVLATATTFALANAEEFYTGDGTAYTLGDTASGNCNMMSALNFAKTDYAALNNDQWSGLQNCGRCAEVSCADSRCADQTKSVVVQILDRCPECKHGDLDLSPSVFKTLTGSDPSRYKVKWKFVNCPVAGNVNYCLKGGSNNYWTAIQPTNVATGVTSLQINGKAAKMLDGAYYYLLDGSGTAVADLSKVTVSLTDLNGVTMKDTLSLSAGSCTAGSSQFPSSGNTPSTPTTTPTTTTPTTNSSTPTTTPPSPTQAPTTTLPPQVPAIQTQTPSVATYAPSPTTSTPSPTQQQQEQQEQQQEQQQDQYQQPQQQYQYQPPQQQPPQQNQWGGYWYPYQNGQQWGGH
ncbi:Carbohydrate-binding protein [Phytophthora megakarya]|uniref:Carbohydrate-binding protein n=1 Tax=Phytophthora megakarya TaxID=4795 RepID=A0A225WLG0_9STRA|nr:Carbohydrate-binding protein [Phytophthora megakarya]